MDTRFTLLLGAGIGAGAMYFFDPDQGRRRRALAQDKLRRYFNRTNDAVEGKMEDLGNRAYGVMAETKAAFSSMPAKEPTPAGAGQGAGQPANFSSSTGTPSSATSSMGNTSTGTSSFSHTS